MGLNAKSDVLNPRHQIKSQEVIRDGIYALVSNWINFLDNSKDNGNSKNRLPMVAGLFNADVGIQEYAENLASKFKF